jgi:hypothetical protein
MVAPNQPLRVIRLDVADGSTTADWVPVGCVRFTPNRDQVGAGNKRRFGPISDIALEMEEAAN